MISGTLASPRRSVFSVLHQECGTLQVEQIIFILTSPLFFASFNHRSRASIHLYWLYTHEFQLTQLINSFVIE